MPLDDVLNPDPLLFDDNTLSSSPFLFTDDNALLTTDATLSNAYSTAQNDLSFTPSDDNTNLFSRRDNNQCLPPVKLGTEPILGTEAQQLFTSPIDSLENLVLPFKGQQTPGDQTPNEPNLNDLPTGLIGDDEQNRPEEAGWQEYTGFVHGQNDDKSLCAEWTSPWGNYPIDLCCDGEYMGLNPATELDYQILDTVDERTVNNRDYAMVYHCLHTFVLPFFPIPSPPLFFLVFILKGGRGSGS